MAETQSVSHLVCYDRAEKVSEFERRQQRVRARGDLAWRLHPGHDRAGWLARAAIGHLSETATTRYVPPYATALIHAGLGDRDACFEGLERAYAMRNTHLTLLPIDPKWDACRADRRFESLLARCAFTASGREPQARG